MKLFILLLLFPILASAQLMNEKIDNALICAKKGIYYLEENISEKKKTFSTELINNDKLQALCKYSKEEGGYRFESTGYYEGVEVKITLYRSEESLRQQSPPDK